jgi:hypothetical protein
MKTSDEKQGVGGGGFANILHISRSIINHFDIIFFLSGSQTCLLDYVLKLRKI